MTNIPNLSLQYGRYAALLAESKACSERRQNPSFHARGSASVLFNHVHCDNSMVPTHTRLNTGDRENPIGSGTLKQMESAVATNMLRHDQVKEIASSNVTSDKSRRGDAKAEDPRGNQMYIDSADISQCDEYERSPNIVKIAGETVNGGDSSCFRPELPPTALLDYLRLLASHRMQSETGRPDDLSETSQDPLALSFSSSALVAMGVLVEELTGEMLISWRRKHYEANRGDRKSVNSVHDIFTGICNRDEIGNIAEKSVGPFGPPTIRGLTIEAKLQLKGAKFFSNQNKSSPPLRDRNGKRYSLKKAAKMLKVAQSRRILGPDVATPALLKNRLEVGSVYPMCLHMIFLMLDMNGDIFVLTQPQYTAELILSIRCCLVRISQIEQKT